MDISFSVTETLLICQKYIPNCECLCKSIPKLSLLMLTRHSPVLQLTVQPVTSQVDGFETLRGIYMPFKTEGLFEFNVYSVFEMNVFRKNSFLLSQKKCTIIDTSGFGYSACGVTVSYPSLLPSWK